jgi:hypothetical protein
MGEYNPDRPYVLGNEFVGLREEGLALTNASDTVEYGVEMSLAAARALDHAKVYMDSPLWSPKIGQLLQVNVYPAGLEDSSGPIQSVAIPASSLGNSVTSGTTIPVAAISGATTQTGAAITSQTLAGALEAPDSGNLVRVPPGIPTDATTASTVNVTFDMPRYLPQLVGKRILGVNILIQAEGAVGADVQALAFGCPLILRAATGAGSWLTNVAVTSSATLQRIKLPAVNPLWNTGALSGLTGEAQIWNTTQLANWNSTAPAGTTRLFAQLLRGSITIPTGVFTTIFSYTVSYLALEIVYCEEMRLATGTAFHRDGIVNQFGAQTIPLRTPAGVAGVTVGPGPIVATVCAPFAQSTTMATIDTTAYPQIPPLNALRELYALSSLPVVTVNKPFPPETALNQVFTEAPSDVIPQLTLHTTTAPIPESQVYGRRDEVPVWGAVTATQVINNNTLGATKLFAQVRFYARHFGMTTFPLQIAAGAVFTSITPATFDALPGPIVDGWKEVTLRLNAVVGMGGTAGTVNWIFSAAGEQIGTRWEVLGAMAPAISGIGGNATQPVVPATDVLSTVTYTPSIGDSIDLIWLSPPISGTSGASDPTSDATLIFSQDPPTPAGLAVTPSSQVLVTALDCLTPPECIPTGLGYNKITWTNPAATVFLDTYTRTVAGGWGTPNAGAAYTLSGTAALFSVNGTQGIMQPAGGGTLIAIEALGTNEQDITTTVGPLPTTGATVSTRNTQGIGLRLTDANNLYFCEVGTDNFGNVSADIFVKVAGSGTTLAAVSLPGLSAAGTINIRAVATGVNIKMKAWAVGTVEPVAWTLSISDPQLVDTNVGLTSFAGATGGLTFTFDNTQGVTPWGFGYLELQRSDAYDGTWQTIMKTYSEGTTFFNDYEARAGILSSYRLRCGNLLGFVGAFSTTATGTVPGSGVTGRNVGTSILMFTTNEHQAGGRNLAYAAAVDSTVENLNFPETGRSQIQWMYGKDFQTAYQPAERGGETFSRSLLASQMAVAGPLLEQGFRGMRDLAWDTITYVCVRNDIGDRWYANVQVSDGSFSRNRFLSNINVQVTETYTSPSIVEPAVQQ